MPLRLQERISRILIPDELELISRARQAIGYSADATKSSNPIISGRPTTGAARRTGAGSFPKSTRRR
jgi:hypothetical protein